jgi:cell wall-associated NlpC family hydrolase
MRRILRSTGAAALVLAAAAFTTLAPAPTTASGANLASKQEQARKLSAQVQELDEKYDVLQERYRGALYELDRIRKDVDQAHRVVVATRRDLSTARGRLADRAAAIYRDGGSGSDLAELASAGSFTDFFERMESIDRIGDQDATVLVRVQALNRRVAAKERVLKQAKRRAAIATRRAERDKEHMEKLRDARKARLDSVNSEIRAIMEAQRRAAEARAAAAARASRNLAKTNETPGSSSSSSSSGGGGVSVPLPPGTGTASAAASAAMGKLGAPYVWAAAGPSSFDCSGLVVWAFAQAGRSGLPHSTYSLINLGVEVPMDQLQVGDLVFNGSIGHVGIYVGGGSFVHAPHTGDVVKVTSLSEYSMVRARRI